MLSALVVVAPEPPEPAELLIPPSLDEVVAPEEAVLPFAPFLSDMPPPTEEPPVLRGSTCEPLPPEAEELAFGGLAEDELLVV